MNVGACVIKLHLPENNNLKGKRQVLKSITDRVHNKFNVSISEVDDNELWQMMTLGISCTSNDARHANEVLSNVVEYIETIRGDAEVVDYHIEVFTALEEE